MMRKLYFKIHQQGLYSFLVKELMKALSEHDTKIQPKPSNDVWKNIIDLDQMLRRIAKDLDGALYGSIETAFENIMP